MVNEFEIKKQLCDIGKRIYNRNMVAANDGNFSVKIAEKWQRMNIFAHQQVYPKVS